ncbi:hypothetical protein E0H73_00545 [Kribbella pittospori]|uniref:Uncharacterized protein n=1 Tax=Kribbella pittospori TaxID=722689 RepID=A0A4R0KWP5_9ACTN|nr:hypothetical protein [Kribbella pittospori]TCC65471.1 hypothetical protein E0H73_00545 [Kribbella pittospori]
MAGWDGLRVDLRRLLEESPGALVVFPHPESERSERRFRIELAAWAAEIAAALDAKYGSLVDLQVGAMTFPARQLWVSEQACQLRGDPAESAGLYVESSSPLSVRTGRFAHNDVLVTNRAEHEQVLFSNRSLTSAVTDNSGTVVGLYVGPSNAVRVGFAIEPHQSRPVPVLIGTASVVPDLGYAVPPGQWQLVIALHTENSNMLSSPLPLTITP